MLPRPCLALHWAVLQPRSCCWLTLLRLLWLHVPRLLRLHILLGQNFKREQLEGGFCPLCQSSVGRELIGARRPAGSSSGGERERGDARLCSRQ